MNEIIEIQSKSSEAMKTWKKKKTTKTVQIRLSKTSTKVVGSNVTTDRDIELIFSFNFKESEQWMKMQLIKMRYILYLKSKTIH